MSCCSDASSVAGPRDELDELARTYLLVRRSSSATLTSDGLRPRSGG